MLGQGFPHCPIFPTAASRRSLGRVSVPMWPVNLSVRLPIVGLVSLYLTNYLIGREPIKKRISPLIKKGCPSPISCGISVSFLTLSPTPWQVAHVLLTRSPLDAAKHSVLSFTMNNNGSPSATPYLCPPSGFHHSTLFIAKHTVLCRAPFDLHVLGAPPAFVLSQDQTLKLFVLYAWFLKRPTLSTYLTPSLTASSQTSLAQRSKLRLSPCLQPII